MEKEDIEYVMNLLRQGTVKWRGRSTCLRRARKKVLVRHSKEGQPIFKYHWQCAKCRKWTANERAMEVDHIAEIGGFSGDWDIMVKKFYCDQKNLQALCVSCHMKKTKKYNSARLNWSRKK